jgi:hypothetical protein
MIGQGGSKHEFSDRKYRWFSGGRRQTAMKFIIRDGFGSLRKDTLCHLRLEWIWKSGKVLQHICITTAQYATEVTVRYTIEPFAICVDSLFQCPALTMVTDLNGIWIAGPLVIKNVVIVNITMLTHLRCQLFINFAHPRLGQTFLPS